MDDVMGRVGEVTPIMDEICAACQDQSSGLNQINQSVAGLDSTVRQNSALVEQATAASAQLETQPRRLKEMVEVFRLA
jgi:methyl-accepting chemotaxis protein